MEHLLASVAIIAPLHVGRQNGWSNANDTRPGLVLCDGYPFSQSFIILDALNIGARSAATLTGAPVAGLRPS